MLKLGIDVDGCIRALIPALVKVYKDFYPGHEVLPITEWYLHPFFPIGEKIYDWAFKKHAKEIFYEEAKPYEDVDDGLFALRDNGFYLTALSYQNTISAQWTQKWLEYYEFPFDEINIILNDTSKKGNGKELTNYDWYFDDSPHNILTYIENSKNVVCRNQPWNVKVNFGNTKRVNSFKEFVDFMLLVKDKKNGN